MSTMEGLHAVRQNGIDAIRGLLVFAMLCVNAPGDPHTVFTQMRHTPWTGYTLTDLIFPGFLFINGASTVFSMESRFARGQTVGAIMRRQATRAAVLFGLGLALNLVTFWIFDLESIRVMGILQRIALCSLLTAIAFAYQGTRGVWKLAAIALVVYGSALLIDGAYAPYLNLPDRIDSALLRSHAAWTDPITGLHRDPEGLMSTLGAVATAAIGGVAAPLIRCHRTVSLCVLGVACFITGYFLSVDIPVIKRIWTPSFSLIATGLATLAVCMGPLLERFATLQILGKNALLAYVGGTVTFEAAFVTDLWTQIHAVMSLALPTIVIPEAVSALQSLGFAFIWLLLFWFFGRSKNEHRRNSTGVQFTE